LASRIAARKIDLDRPLRRPGIVGQCALLRRTAAADGDGDLQVVGDARAGVQRRGHQHRALLPRVGAAATEAGQQDDAGPEGDAPQFRSILPRLGDGSLLPPMASSSTTVTATATPPAVTIQNHGFFTTESSWAGGAGCATSVVAADGGGA